MEFSCLLADLSQPDACGRWQGVLANIATETSNVPITSEVPAKLLGVDETGGVLHLHAPCKGGAVCALCTRPLKSSGVIRTARSPLCFQLPRLP